VAAASTRYPNNLPISSSSFIGRERESSEVKRLMASTRLLTLTGPGGCGKTRLAVAVAESLLKSSGFEQGAWFVDLAGLDAPILIPQVVATELGVPEAHDRPLSETLTGFLQHRKLLLILDNCEHLLSACAELAQMLLNACPHLHILATSREPLNLPGETMWLVPSLALPDPQHPVHFKQWLESEAIQLFVARASAALPGFKLHEDNAAIVERICRRLDGIPLAIELAAARVKLLDVRQIADRLDDSLQLLTRGSRAAAPRHQTMRAALDWSYRLLVPREQILFRRLSVFAGGFTLDAVEAVGADPESGDAIVRAAEVLDVLSDLVDKSLALIAEREPGEAVRYRLLEPIRLYALDQLREAGAETATRDRHLAYFVDFAEQAEPKIKSESQMQWLQRLDKEHDNFRAALAWSMQGNNRDVNGLRLAKALHIFWQRRGYWSEGCRWLEGAIVNYDTHRDPQSPGGELYLGRAIIALGWLAVYLQDYSNTRKSLERGLALAQESGDSVTAAHALGLLAFLSSYAGNFTTASQFAVASVVNARQAGEPWSLAWSLHVFGRNRYAMGDEKAGRTALEESETLYRKTGDQRSLAVHINNEAIIAQNAGEFDGARRLFEEVLAIGQDLDDQELQIKATSNLAGLAFVQGDLARTQQLYERTLAQARDLGIKGTIAVSLLGLGHVRIAQGHLDTANDLLHESLPLFREIGHRVGIAMVLAGLGRIAAAQGQVARAARVLGAIDAFLTTNPIRLDADSRVPLEQDNATVRAAMTPEEFEAGFAVGHTFTLEQASQEIMSLAWENQRDVQLPAPAINTLRLNALGPTQVFLGDQLLTTWSYARVKELLFYLITHPARTKAQIGLALWPEASPSKLRNGLSTAIYHLRRALGNPQWIIFEDELYRFNRTLDYRFDVEVFEAKLIQAAHVQAQQPERASALLQEAIDLYQGDFVEDLLEGDWFLLRREELRRKYLAALLDLGQLSFAQGHYARAAESYRRAIEKDEVLEEAHRELLRCYARLGERGQALRHYQTFEQMIRDELGSAPAAESVALYERLKRGEEV
jgi:predicted ATPase/DNA-binding SARP family transcriptional activator